MSLSLTPRYLGVCLQVRVRDMDFSWQMRVVTEVGLELDCGVVDGMGEHMEFYIDRVCSELGFRNIPEVSTKNCIPLHIGAWYPADVAPNLHMYLHMP